MSKNKSVPCFRTKILFIYWTKKQHYLAFKNDLHQFMNRKKSISCFVSWCTFTQFIGQGNPKRKQIQYQSYFILTIQNPIHSHHFKNNQNSWYPRFYAAFKPKFTSPFVAGEISILLLRPVLAFPLYLGVLYIVRKAKTFISVKYVHFTIWLLYICNKPEPKVCTRFGALVDCKTVNAWPIK